MTRTAPRQKELEARWFQSLSAIDAEAWDSLALPLKAPFLEWEWLHAMESSGSIAPETGWAPLHLTLWDGARLAAAAPLYIKGHSEGEFVFDHMWWEVSEKIGVPYYPKLVGMSPVTPLAGYRFLVAPDQEEAAVTERLVGEINAVCRANRLSGCSFLHVDPGWQKQLEERGFSAWTHQSFQWVNEDFASFEDYLARFRTNQRRNIRRERRSLDRAGIRITPLTGDEIPASYFPLMYRYYATTNEKFGPWGCKYLTRDFFEQIAVRYRHRLLVMAAFSENSGTEPLALSMLLVKDRRLYGRYWGSAETVNHLHFNLCYYEPIRWAIENGIRTYDPGMGGFHKVRRGFRSVGNTSLHRFYHPHMQSILQTNIDRINQLERANIDELNRAIPFTLREQGDG
ncbi:MAG: GNAT family N-acetyltransferase [Desulfobacteraceae bacterium]|nr:GNAT family N-acetyltransferase [Desulfobacteraceae bacterium]